METLQVTNSSNIASVSHDGAGTLTVEFKSGTKYKYAGVPYSQFREFAAAESKGAYFATNIKGQFTGEKL